jgi:hypothetical protein
VKESKVISILANVAFAGLLCSIGVLSYYYPAAGIMVSLILVLCLMAYSKKSSNRYTDECSNEVFSSLHFYCALSEKEKSKFSQGIREAFYEGKSPREFYGLGDLGGEDEEESVTMGDMVERYNNGI